MQKDTCLPLPGTTKMTMRKLLIGKVHVIRQVGIQRYLNSLHSLTIPGVMGWLAGLQHKPINDEKPAITVYFDHNCLERNNKHTICYCIVSACGKQITFPIAHMNSPGNFKEIFIVGYYKSQSFGRP